MPSTPLQTLRQHAYLEALGVSYYVARRDLPGAAPGRRQQWDLQPATPAVDPAAAPPQSPGARPPVPERPSGRRQKPVEQPATEAAAVPAVAPGPVVRFTLGAVIAGPFVWLEALPNSVLGKDQVRLIKAMAQALGPVSAVQVARFDWPPHNNRQLDLGEEAARAALHSFLARQLEQQGCRALVALGEGAAARLGDNTAGASGIDAHCITAPASTADMLADPRHKRAVWEAIRPLRDARPA